MTEVAIRLHVEPLDEGGYVGTSPDVPGLVIEGRSLMEVAELAQHVTRTIMDSCLDHGDPLPPVFRRMGDPKLIDLVIPVNLP